MEYREEVLVAVIVVLLLLMLSLSYRLYANEQRYEHLVKIYESVTYQNFCMKAVNTTEEFNFVQGLIKNTPSDLRENYSDGYHSYGELYEFRKMYNAAFFNKLAEIPGNPYNVNKSMRHSDGELSFGGGWFIVAAELPTGQISNHYTIENWDLFKVPDYDQAILDFDGHTPSDVLERMYHYLKTE